MAAAPTPNRSFVPKPPHKSAEEIAAAWLEEVQSSLPPLHQVHPIEHVRANLPELLKRLEER